MSRMRVLVFTETALALSETFIAAHCRSLQRYEYKLAALCPSGDHHGDVPRDLLYADDRPFALTRLAFRLGWNPRLDALIKSFRPDIIHAHYLTSGAFLLPYAVRHGIPLVATAHGHDALRLLRKHSVYDQLYGLRRRQLMQQAAMVLPVSNFLREELLEQGFSPERTRTHYLGIELPTGPQANPAGNPPHIAFVGRLVAKKGVDVLLQAFAIVRAARPEAELHIVGDGPLRYLLQQPDKAPCGVVWHGAQPPERAQQIMRRSRLLTLPSRITPEGDAEGLGLVLIEAQTLGIPVVTSISGATAEAVLPGTTGLAVDGTSPQALAQAFLQLLNDPQHAGTLGANARQWACEHFDIRLQTQSLEQLYDDILQGRIQP